MPHCNIECHSLSPTGTVLAFCGLSLNLVPSSTQRKMLLQFTFSTKAGRLMLPFLSRSTAVVCNCCPLRHLASGAHPVFCPVMTKTELPGTPPPRPLAPAARGNETLPVSVRPQRSPAGTPAPGSHHPPPRTAARLRWHLPWPGERGRSAGAASSAAAVQSDPSSGSGSMELQGA